MKIRFELVNDKGETELFLEEDAMKPSSFRTHPERPLQDSKFKLYGFSYQPQVVLKPLEPTR